MAEGIAEPELNAVELTARIVSAYVSNNPISATELPRMIAEVHATLSNLGSAAVPRVEEKPVPAISIRKSVTPDFLICLEDGKKFKSLKRHLATHYELTPDQYRAKWGLAADYPMVAPNYSATRSRMAHAIGLGRKAEPVPEPITPPARAPRKKLGLKFS